MNIVDVKTAPLPLPLLKHRDLCAQVLQACGDGASSIFYLSPTPPRAA